MAAAAAWNTRGVRRIDAEEGAELRVGEPGSGRFRVIDAKLGLFHLRAEGTQVGQHGVEELAGVPRPRIAPATGEGLADGRRPLRRGNTALLQKRHRRQDERLGVAPRLLQQLGVGVLGVAVLDGEVSHG